MTNHSNNIIVYMGMKTHRDIGITCLRFVVNGKAHDEVAMVSKHAPHYYLNDAMLATLLYVYKNTDISHHDVEIRTNRNSILEIIKHLDDWEAQHWQPCNETTSQMYDYARAHHTRVSFKKIPSNYANDINIFKRIKNGITAFKNHIKFDLISRKDPEYLKLSTFMTDYMYKLCAKILPNDNIPRPHYSMIEVPINQTAKIKFINACHRNGTTVRALIQKSVKSYINRNGDHIDDVTPDDPR